MCVCTRRMLAYAIFIKYIPKKASNKCISTRGHKDKPNINPGFSIILKFLLKIDHFNL